MKKFYIISYHVAATIGFMYETLTFKEDHGVAVLIVAVLKDQLLAPGAKVRVILSTSSGTASG